VFGVICFVVAGYWLLLDREPAEEHELVGEPSEQDDPHDGSGPGDRQHPEHG
jgi:hypothetical protein